ncbi:hypothetical protein G9A89_020730 [Geosiphon pyriformis]|nr:hypothetical protein G9A89_020730 [Geosiphon pyriformis]
MHPVDLPTAVIYVKDFEAAELEANHTQAVNLAMNKLSELNSKLKQFRKRKLFLKSVMSIIVIQSVVTARDAHSEPSPESRPIPIHLLVYDTPTNLSITSLSNFSLSTTTTNNLSGAVTSNISTTATSNLSNTHHSNTTSKPSSNDIRESKIEDHPKLEISDDCTLTNLQLFPLTIRIFLLVTPEDTTFSNQEIEQQQPPINNISPATITKNESLDAIFLFELEEPLDMPLFSEAALEEKPIMAMYTDAKINSHFIKLIFDSGHQVDCTASARIITVDGATKIPIGKIDDFPIEVNGIVVPIKVLVMEAIQYQALVAICGYFKATNTTASLIDIEKEKPKPTWEAYQVSWADEEHNELLPILLWDDNDKGKQKETELTWNTDQTWETNQDLEEPPSWEWEEREKGKKKGKKKTTPISTTIYNSYTDSSLPINYH